MTRLAWGLGALVVTALALVGCSPQSSQNVAPTTQPPAASPSPSASQVIDEAPVILADGRHPVLLKTIDVPGRAITFDLIQFLTGAAAKAAWDKDHPGEEGPPNDYYIVNNNPRLRTLPVAASVLVQVVNRVEPGGAPVTVPFADLPTYAADGFPYWLTVSGGQITRIEEQFVP